MGDTEVFIRWGIFLFCASMTSLKYQFVVLLLKIYSRLSKSPQTERHRDLSSL